GGMGLMRDGKATPMTFDAFADQVGQPGKAAIEERIHARRGRIDNDQFVVWAPFEFLVDGKVDHCGTDLFNLVRTDGKWLIASVADTGRNTVRSSRPTRSARSDGAREWNARLRARLTESASRFCSKV